MTVLHNWVRRQAAARPNATALVHGNRRVSYGELERWSNQLAHQLRALGCLPGDRVCLLQPKSPEAIATIIAVLKADAAYVPLDPASPAPRLAKMIEVCDTRWLVAGGPVAPLLAELLAGDAFRRDAVVGWVAAEDAPVPQGIAFTGADVAGQSETSPRSVNTPDDPAYMLFTSGSTGMPKAVVISHRNVGHFIRWAVSYFRIGPDDRLSAHPPLHFDLSVFDIFGAFAAGAELHLVPAELSLLAPKLAELIRRSELTQWFSVPSALTYMTKFNVVREGDFPALRRVLWCGEVLPTPTLIHWMKRVPHATFTNLYGPTETTIASSYYTVPACPSDERAPIPIGSACPGEELLVLDDAMRPVPPGDIGELYIGGVGLSSGYWRDMEKTAAAFRTYDDGTRRRRVYRTGDLARAGADGMVYFVGRADTQIKSRGYRIELGEIEAALQSLGELREAAVVAVPSTGFENWIICCAYVRGAAAPSLDAATLREQLGRLLPAYMLPARWQTMDCLPRNANGKVDRRALRDRFQSQASVSDATA